MQTRLPNFSVIIPCSAAHAKYLPRCIASVAAQLTHADEILVCLAADCPPQPLLPGFASWFGPAPVRMWTEPERGPEARSPGRLTGGTPVPPGGISAARNLCLKHAGGDWIKFLDADDVCAPYAISTVRSLEIPERCILLAGQQYTVHNGRVHGLREPSTNFIHRANPFLPSATFVRRQAVLDVGGFDERIGFEEDWDLWLKLRRVFGVETMGVLHFPVCYYWIDDAERAAKTACHEVEGMDVREYFRRTYGIDPIR